MSIILCLTSCLFNLTKDFYVYKLPVVEQEKEIPLKLDGVYLCNQKHGSVFYLFADGSCKWAGWGAYCCPLTGEPVPIENIEQGWPFSSRQAHWGHYAIIGDSIIIQDFTKNNQEIVNHWIIEFKGKILNDTTFELYTWYSYWGKDSLEFGTQIYNYYPTEIKPDSSDIWFNNKKWFKKGLHESRNRKDLDIKN